MQRPSEHGRLRLHWAALIAVLCSLCSLLPTPAMAIEEPSYDVVRRLDGAEVRQYAPYVVA